MKLKFKTKIFLNTEHFQGPNAFTFSFIMSDPRSLFCLAKESLTISLLKLRSRNGLDTFDTSIIASSFSIPHLVERITTSKGIEVLHLISALPHSGLRPDLLELLQFYHPVNNLLNLIFY